MPRDPDKIRDVSDVFLIDDTQQAWLRTFPLLASFGDRTPVPSALVSEEPIPPLDHTFWRTQTEALERRALTRCSERNIDGIFYEVTHIINEDLLRFDPMIDYFGQHFPDGDPVRIEIETDIAHCVKRDLAWMMVEWLIDERGFFTQLKPWYDQGRWPHAWKGEFPSGCVVLK